MLFNSKQREEPYPHLTILLGLSEMIAFGSAGEWIGAAWLSSARVVRCLVKSSNERNPYRMLPAFSWALMRDCRWQAGGRRGRRQVIMALTCGATNVLQWQWQWAATSRGEANLQKLSQFGLFSATREHEVGIASNRRSERYGEYVPGSCTHRPSRHGSWFYPKVLR
jgi:hypothetical protein